MRFTSELPPFLAAVKRARSTIESRQTIPILGCAHIKAADNDLRITGTNMDEWVSVKCPASVADPGAICVDAGLLLAWLAAAPKGSLVSGAIEDGRLILTAGRATASFAVMDALDYPAPEKSEKGEEVSNAFAAFDACLPFAAQEEARRYLNGVAIDRGHAVATDGHRLCAVHIGSPETVSAIIPSSGVRQITQFGEGARLWVGENAWRCEGAGVVAGGKLLAETFPDWERTTPKAQPIGTADADEMAGAIAQVIVASGEKSRGVKLIGGDAEISMTCQGPLMTASGGVAYDGDAFELGINGKYADAALRAFSGNVVSLAVTDNVALLTCKALPGLRVVVMGMRL